MAGNNVTDLNKGQELVCKECGFKNDPKFKFCGNCGASLKEDQKEKQSVKRTNTKKSGPNTISNNFIFSVLAVVGILAFIIYYFTQQNKSPVPVSAGQPQIQAPVQTPMVDMQKIADLKSKIEANPTEKGTILELANLYHDASIFDQAILYYQKYLVLDEKNPDARIDMAVCYYSAGKNDIAIKEIEKSLKFNPNHQKAYFNLGIITLNSGKMKEANEYFKKCYDIDPKTEVAMQSKEILEQHKTAINKSN
jgi:tetratricopeptide (TPR) repeat protein